MTSIPRCTITANQAFGRGFWKRNRSLQNQTTYPAPAPRSIFPAQTFLCHIIHHTTIPIAAHTPPMTALTVGESRAENSVSASLHAREVHTRRRFHTVKINTIHTDKVTGKGRMFYFGSASKYSKSLPP